MKPLSYSLKNYKGANPFSNPQARNYSDKKVINEFQPTKDFWDLFNEQHELIIGSRGSGKTILLRMMRLSMLKKINENRAKKLVSSKEYIALYVPMKLDFVSYYSRNDLTEVHRLRYFYFSFNCLLADSLINELISITEEQVNKLILNNKLTQELNEAWFDNYGEQVGDLRSLQKKISNYFYKFSIDSDLSAIIERFTKEIASLLKVVKYQIVKILELKIEPKWIVCIDEAEFLQELFQKSLNSVFRSNSYGIIFKIATLPFKLLTYQTLDANLEVSEGNDFNFRTIDMDPDNPDFKAITNKLCSNRMGNIFSNNSNISLENFVGTVKSDKMMDYYLYELKKEEEGRIFIDKRILEQLSQKTLVKYESKYGSKEHMLENEKLKKPLFDKLAPIVYLRDMRKLAKKGSKIPGWFAGSNYIRKAAQGNPRMFIILMNLLFNSATKKKLTTKQQHLVVYNFSKSFCDSTMALEKNGPEAMKNLNYIADCLSSRIHDNNIIDGGNTFLLDLDNDEIEKNKCWIHQSVAHSRLLVDENSLLYGITRKTRYTLCNPYSIYYWIPMRKYKDIKIKLKNEENKNLYTVKGQNRHSGGQISMFEEVDFNA